MNLFTVSFEAVGNANGKATLNDVMASTDLTSYSEDGNTPGDYIESWDMSIGNWGGRFYYVNQPSWNEGELDYTDTWMDSDFAPCNPEMLPGSSFWLYSTKDIPALQFAGQVTTGTLGYTLTGGRMNLCGNPYPMTLNLADKDQVTIANATSYSEDGNTPGDYVETWDLSIANWGGRFYYVNQPSWNEGELDYTDTWMNSDFAPIGTEIGSGSGFWYFPVADGVTLTFSAK